MILPKTKNFSAKHFKFEGNGFKNTMQKIFKVSHNAWDIFLKPAIKTLPPVFGMAAGARIEHLKVAQATRNTLMSISGGKFLSLTGLHGKN